MAEDIVNFFLDPVAPSFLVFFDPKRRYLSKRNSFSRAQNKRGGKFIILD